MIPALKGLTTNDCVSLLYVMYLLCYLQTDLPGGGVTVGLTTAKTVVRVVIRDLAGKVSWDSSVLYGPPKCRSGSYPAGMCTLTLRFMLKSLNL